MLCHRQQIARSRAVVLILVGLLACSKQAACFCFLNAPSHQGVMTTRLPSPTRIATLALRASSNTNSSPSMEQLASDPFLSQLSHASELVSQLALAANNHDEKSNTEELTERLSAQLSHADGIRGFFATYLTADAPGGGDEELGGDDTRLATRPAAADLEQVPTPLATAMTRANLDELVPLACMNAVMPTATSSMHTDPVLSAASQKTAVRGTRILTSLLHVETMKENCVAIYAASTSREEEKVEGADAELVEYWKSFFTNYGYAKKQREDIARVFQGFATF